MATVTIEQAHDTIRRLLIDAGVSSDRAHRMALLYTLASRDGVYSHGLHFIPHILRALSNGTIKNPNVDPELVSVFGAIERHDGRYSLLLVVVMVASHPGSQPVPVDRGC